MLKNIKLWIASFFEKKEEIKEEIKEGIKPIATYHAKKRLEQRHGEVLTDKMTASFIGDIKSKKAEFLKETRDNAQAWIVSYNNKKYRVIYSYETEIIVTIYSCIKNKKIKPNRRFKNKMRKRNNNINRENAVFLVREKKTLKKLYKRNKRVEYSEII